MMEPVHCVETTMQVSGAGAASNVYGVTMMLAS
jgi:hypothetical protein